MIDPLFGRVVAAAFALLLLSAAWHKLSANAAFRAALAEYQLIPVAMLPLAAWLLPCCELLLAVAWLAGHATAAAPLTALLLAVYALAMALNLLRGRVYIGCGCSLGGSPASDTPLSWWLVVRNLLLSGLALLGALPTTGRTLGTHDRLTVVLATLACIVLFAGASQLLRNRAGMAAWRRPRD